jgi:hypothetical protein
VDISTEKGTIMTNSNIPELPAHCGSWIIVHKGTKEAVVELFNRASVERINFNDYEALPASEYLARYNSIIAAEKN